MLALAAGKLAFENLIQKQVFEDLNNSNCTLPTRPTYFKFLNMRLHPYDKFVGPGRKLG